MDVLKLIFNFLFGTFISLGNYFATWWTNALDAGFEMPIFTMALIFLSIAVVLGSGFATMSFAEMKFRNRGLHFVGGVILPFAYPLLFFYLVPKVGGDKSDEEEEAFESDVDEEEGEAASAEEAATVPESEFTKIDQPDDPVSGGFPEPATPLEMNQEFFARIARLEDGTQAGPFKLELADGTELEIISIVDAMPEVLSVEIAVEGEVRKIRLPYNRISDCIVLTP